MGETASPSLARSETPWHTMHHCVGLLRGFDVSDFPLIVHRTPVTTLAIPAALSLPFSFLTPT